MNRLLFFHGKCTYVIKRLRVSQRVYKRNNNDIRTCTKRNLVTVIVHCVIMLSRCNVFD